MDTIRLENADGGMFLIHGGPRDGARLRVRRVPSRRRKGFSPFHASREPEPGWRHVGSGAGDIDDLETGETIEVLTDARPEISHHDGHDAAGSLDAYLAVEAAARTIERANRMPLISGLALNTLRSVRPDMPAPEPRCRIWPGGEWTEDVAELWKIDPGGDAYDRRGGYGPKAVANLEFALRRATDPGAMMLTPNMRELSRYLWFRPLREVSRIRPVKAARERAKEPGVHTVKNLAIEVHCRKNKHQTAVPPRRVDAPMWVENRWTLLVRPDFAPTIEEVAAIMAPSGTSSDPRDAIRYATKLLGQAGEAETLRKLARDFTRELAGRLGSELEVAVSIRPRGSEED